MVAVILLFTSAIAGIGLLEIGKHSQSMALSCERDVQLRYDLEGCMEEICHEIEEKKFQVEDELPLEVKTKLRDERNDRKVRLTVYAERFSDGILLFGIAENGTIGTKSIQGFMEKQEDCYRWSYWIPWKNG